MARKFVNDVLKNKPRSFLALAEIFNYTKIAKFNKVDDRLSTLVLTKE